jgi:hypothetical protein
MHRRRCIAHRTKGEPMKRRSWMAFVLVAAATWRLSRAALPAGVVVKGGWIVKGTDL